MKKTMKLWELWERFNKEALRAVKKEHKGGPIPIGGFEQVVKYNFSFRSFMNWIKENKLF